MKTLIATALSVFSLGVSATAGVAATPYESSAISGEAVKSRTIEQPAPYESPAIRGEDVKSRTIDQPAPQVVLVPVSDGFEWGDAAVGAAAAMGLMLVTAAALGLRRVQRRPA